MGRLGILVQVTLRVVLQKSVQRELQTITFPALLQQLTLTQQAYVAALQNGSLTAIADALAQIDETQVLQQLLALRINAAFAARCCLRPHHGS